MNPSAILWIAFAIFIVARQVVMAPNPQPARLNVGSSLTGRIAGGIDAATYKILSFVSIKIANRDEPCNGVLVNEKLVLTSANCINDYDIRKFQVARSHRSPANWEDEVKTIGVDRKCIARDYNGGKTNPENYGFLRLKEPFKHAERAHLPGDRMKTWEKASTFSVGDLHNGKKPLYVQESRTTVRDCGKDGEETHESFICFEAQGAIQTGDDGAPTMIEKDGKWYIMGIKGHTYIGRSSRWVSLDTYARKQQIMELAIECLGNSTLF